MYSVYRRQLYLLFVHCKTVTRQMLYLEMLPLKFLGTREIMYEEILGEVTMNRKLFYARNIILNITTRNQNKKERAIPQSHIEQG